MQFIDLTAQRKRIGDRLEAAIAKVIKEGCYILGPEVTEFEKKFAAYIGVKHVIACANGTDALLMPLIAQGIGPGDAVFCPSFTFAATAEVVALVGAKPVFVDIDPNTYNMNIAHLEDAIAYINKEGRLQPKAIIPVDLFGLSADYDTITRLAEHKGLFIIEDAAQSIGGKSNNVMCGAFGHVGATSFYPTKPLGCYGDGGAMLTNSDELADTVRSILFHGKGETQYDNIRIGLNSRLDTIQAAILIEKLTILEDELNARQKVAKRYSEGLKNVVKVPYIPTGYRSAWAQYSIESENRDRLKAQLQAEGISSMIYYIKPLHLQQAYKHYSVAPGGLPVSESLSSRILSLPMHPYLTEADQEQIIHTICAFHGKMG